MSNFHGDPIGCIAEQAKKNSLFAAQPMKKFHVGLSPAALRDGCTRRYDHLEAKHLVRTCRQRTHGLSFPAQCFFVRVWALCRKAQVTETNSDGGARKMSLTIKSAPNQTQKPKTTPNKTTNKPEPEESGSNPVQIRRPTQQ